jgi:hypothetical protein
MEMVPPRRKRRGWEDIITMDCALNFSGSGLGQEEGN